jgi:lipid A 3-O-deacylase
VTGVRHYDQDEPGTLSGYRAVLLNASFFNFIGQASRMRLSRKFALLGLFLAPVVGAAGAVTDQPWSTSAFSIETGVLWEVGSGTPFAYRLVPTQLSWRSAKVFGHEFDDGSILLVRHRITLLGTWIESGPETHYIAIDGSPSIEWWNKTGTWALVGGSGGGLGGLDSRGVKGGQGQDFTFNWFIRGGIEHVISPGRSLSAGIMYQHMSNGGQTKPNPGIDALGFSLGYAWKY